MKKYDTPWSVGSMFLCSKCGAAFDKPEMADKLKSELRSHLKNQDKHKKIRVMVTGCLNVCNRDQQTVMYQPIAGETEIFTIGKNLDDNLEELKQVLNKKLK